jgi:two-component system nitrate/nitrite response regulator NarL
LIRVWIETSSTILRSGLAALLESGAGLEPADSATNADVILRETTLNHAPSSGTPVVVLTDAPPSPTLLRASVRAVLPRHAPPEQIVAALHAAATGLIALPAESAAAMPASLNGTSEHASQEVLTPRELETLEMMSEGLSNKQIAYRLGISDHTAKFHVNSIFAKLEAGTRTEAVMRGIRLGLVKL